MKEIFINILLSLGLFIIFTIPESILWLITSFPGTWAVVAFLIRILLPLLCVLLAFLKKNRKRAVKLWAIVLCLSLILSGANWGFIKYDESITINTSPSIQVDEYLPFQEESKIVKLEYTASLSITNDLPIVDGAAAVFPVYSAFVNATYPDTTTLYDGYFEYNNTVSGYRNLAKRRTDIFFGAYPSEEQIAYAQEQNTTFVFTPIGKEAFVFFVHKDNPINNLTTEQIRGIYTGEITNWKQVGGKNEPIFAYQRNEGSGSQSMFLRFMDGHQPIQPSTETKIDGMLDIVETVADYRNKEGSIGFSFRYYLEGIIQNPDIKLLSIDGISPSVENIQNGTYPITADLYAVTYENNDNDNVRLLLEWVLSDEGQEIIRCTGYVPLMN